MAPPPVALVEAIGNLRSWKPESGQEFYEFLMGLHLIIDDLDEAVAAIFDAAGEDDSEYIDGIRSSLLAAASAAQDAGVAYYGKYEFFLTHINEK